MIRDITVFIKHQESIMVIELIEHGSLHWFVRRFDNQILPYPVGLSRTIFNHEPKIDPIIFGEFT